MRAATFIAVLLMCGCVSQLPGCERPYILSGEGCCIDLNGDGSCDGEEPAPTTLPTTTTQSTTTTAPTTSTSTTTPAKPVKLIGAVIDVQSPDGLVREFNILLDSPEKPIIGDLHMAAYGGDVFRMVVWNSSARIEYDNRTGKVYLPPGYDEEVSPLKLKDFTGWSVGDKALLGEDEYYFYSTKPERMILARGRGLDDLAVGKYMSEYEGYKFKIYGMLYDNESASHP